MWMIQVRTKSGAEVTAVQTLREFRATTEFREASWTAPALWRFASRQNDHEIFA
jgi:hypothetical protein